jgi:hypothetical protein
MAETPLLVVETLRTSMMTQMVGAGFGLRVGGAA